MLLYKKRIWKKRIDFTHKEILELMYYGPIDNVKSVEHRMKTAIFEENDLPQQSNIQSDQIFDELKEFMISLALSLSNKKEKFLSSNREELYAKYFTQI